VIDTGGVLLGSDPPQTVRLKSKPIGRGGQAVVYVSEADPDLAVKLYHRPADDVEARLEGMLSLARAEDFLIEGGAGHPELAWPTAVVRDPETQQVIGYAMRCVGRPEFFPLAVLFDSRQRRHALDDVSWRFFVGVARNLSGLVATLHERELVLGDMSQANVVVSQQGYLTFLDCDSMQFVAPGTGTRFPCLVMTASYAAPEVQRGRLARTPESDSFSLAVLVSQLLLMGDHPFQGRRLDAGADDESGTTEYLRDGYSYLVRPEEIGLPVGAYDPALLPPRLYSLARRAFGEGHNDPAARPAAVEWLDALDEAELSLTACAVERLHVYSDHLTACPWCERVANGLPDPFVPRAAPRVPTPAPVVQEMRWSPAAIAFALLIIAIIVLAVVL
jgi:DNA-binding helix-hairpin-helix protein with protein kinase domain